MRGGRGDWQRGLYSHRGGAGIHNVVVVAHLRIFGTKTIKKAFICNRFHFDRIKGAGFVWIGVDCDRDPTIEKASATDFG